MASHQTQKGPQKADLLIHPSRNNDPWSRTIIEAMVLGVPVISHGKYNKFVKHNITGFLLTSLELYRIHEVYKNTLL